MNRSVRGYLFGCLGLVIMVNGAVLAGNNDNLVPDPEFREADFSPPHYSKVIEQGLPWIRHQVRTPAEVSKDGSSVHLEGGAVYLHSDRFEVVEGETYRASIMAAGEATVSVQILWWRDRASPAIAIEPTELKSEDGQLLEGIVEVPEGSAMASMRIVVEDGAVTVSSPLVIRQ